MNATDSTMTGKTSTSARFWDRVAEGYSRKPVPDEAIYQEKLRITRTHMTPDSEVLEFGCGSGSTAIAHAPFVKRILATDISAKMIEIAEGKADTGNVNNVAFRQTSIEDLDVPDASFDIVLGLSILHLVADWRGAIAKVHRILKPGGVFVSSTACLGDSMSIFRFIGPIGRTLGLLPMLRVFKVFHLEDALRTAGFEIEHQWQPGNNRLKGVFIVARKPE